MKGKKLYQLNHFEFFISCIQILFWWPLQAIAGFVLLIPGLFIVPLVIKKARITFTTGAQLIDWKYKQKSTGQTFKGTWKLITVPKTAWYWLWSNDRDGLAGDKRGWWATEKCKGNPYTFWAMYQWAALRNPVNNLRFTSLCGCKTWLCDFSTYGSNITAGDDKDGAGWQFTIGKVIDGYRCYFGFTAWIPYPFWKDHGCLIKFGNKIDGRTEDETNLLFLSIGSPKKKFNEWEKLEFIKGCAFYINPFQDI